MKTSVSLLFAVAATTLLLHATESVAAAAPARLRQNAALKIQVPLQVNEQAAAPGWKKPVVDKKALGEPAKSLTQAKRAHDAMFTKKQKKPSAAHPPADSAEHERDDKGLTASGAKEATPSTASAPQPKAKTSTKDAVAAKKKKPAAKSADAHAPPVRKESRGKPSAEKSAKQHSSAAKATSSAAQHDDDAHQREHASTSVHGHAATGQQSYSELQIGAEARAAGAAVMTQMAESFRDEANKSLAFVGAVAGLVVGVLVVIVALVALNRQHSEFAVVELESDLSEIESGRVQDVRVAEREAAAAVVDADAVDDDAELSSDDDDDDEGDEDGDENELESSAISV